MTHDELLQLIPLAAIDAVSNAERAAVRQHVAVCPSCASLLAEYERVAEALLTSTPSATPLRNLESKLRERVRALSAPRTSRRFWQVWFTLPRWAMASTAVALLALVALSAWAVFAPRGDTITAEIKQLLQSPGALSVNIQGTERAPDATGQIIIAPDARAGYLVVSNLATLPPQQTYQVWLIRDGQRDSAALFRVNERGWATLRLQAPRPFTAYQEIGVSVEPAGGSPWPTTGRVIGGPLVGQ